MKEKKKRKGHYSLPGRIFGEVGENKNLKYSLQYEDK